MIKIYKPSPIRFLYDICSALVTFIIIYFAGISVHNTFSAILFSIMGLIIIMSLIYLPIALYNENRGSFKTFLYGYYYLMVFFYFSIMSILFIIKVIYK